MRLFKTLETSHKHVHLFIHWKNTSQSNWRRERVSTPQVPKTQKESSTKIHKIDRKSTRLPQHIKSWSITSNSDGWQAKKLMATSQNQRLKVGQTKRTNNIRHRSCDDADVSEFSAGEIIGSQVGLKTESLYTLYPVPVPNLFKF